jgi:regulation of enolase protein 1 (concanavalin A-like superfamily)
VRGPDSKVPAVTTIRLPGIPFTLTASAGSFWDIDRDPGAISTTAAPLTDIFIDPVGDSQDNAKTALNADTLMGEAPEGDFRFWARVTVGFESAFDAGVLLLWFSEQHWAKLCFEFSPDREPMVVSVVNRGVSDDANGFVVDGTSVWLRVSRVRNAYAYHASLDGTTWILIRVFRLDEQGAALRVGFESQSPTGEGCSVRFDSVGFDTVSIGDLRDGT